MLSLTRDTLNPSARCCDLKNILSSGVIVTGFFVVSWACVAAKTIGVYIKTAVVTSSREAFFMLIRPFLISKSFVQVHGALGTAVSHYSGHVSVHLGVRKPIQHFFGAGYFIRGAMHDQEKFLGL